MPGQLIVAAGLPGAGKSTVMASLAGLMNVPVLLEPEEEKWGRAVWDREQCGRFTALMWFRSARVPLLYEAHARRKRGETVLLDTYYDKLITHYIGKPGIEWLIAPDDPYFEVAQRVAALDYAGLPDADVVVLFHVDQETWSRLLLQRSRSFDQAIGLSSEFQAQEHILDAARRFAHDRGARAVEFHQAFDSPDAAARRLLRILSA